VRWTYQAFYSSYMYHCQGQKVKGQGHKVKWQYRPIVWWKIRDRHTRILAQLPVRNERRFEGHLPHPG